MEWSFLQYLTVIVAVLVVPYVLIRLWSYGIFRSYFQAKKEEEKENGKAK
jgi:cytochrome bd-type quinol oxidase subunit 2